MMAVLCPYCVNEESFRPMLKVAEQYVCDKCGHAAGFDKLFHCPCSRCAEHRQFDVTERIAELQRKRELKLEQQARRAAWKSAPPVRRKTPRRESLSLQAKQEAALPPVYVEAVPVHSTPAKPGLSRDFLQLRCLKCTSVYHLHHDGLDVRQLEECFIEARKQIVLDHPDHERPIVLSAVRRLSSAVQGNGIPASSN